MDGILIGKKVPSATVYRKALKLCHNLLPCPVDSLPKGELVNLLNGLSMDNHPLLVIILKDVMEEIEGRLFANADEYVKDAVENWDVKNWPYPLRVFIEQDEDFVQCGYWIPKKTE
jgi:hypothetical protein